MAFFAGVIESLDLDIKELAVDVEKRKVTAMLHAIYYFKGFGYGEAKEPVKGWTTEYMWLHLMSEDGTNYGS
jgi:hypothetical protein